MYGGIRLTHIYLINGGRPVTSRDNGANFSCVVANPAIMGKNITRSFRLNIRCKPRCPPPPT
jgi:hypothetical protein